MHLTNTSEWIFNERVYSFALKDMQNLQGPPPCPPNMFLHGQCILKIIHYWYFQLHYCIKQLLYCSFIQSQSVISILCFNISFNNMLLVYAWPNKSTLCWRIKKGLSLSTLLCYKWLVPSSISNIQLCWNIDNRDFLEKEGGVFLLLI